MHARNGREYRLPELPQFSVDGYCAETRTVYEFLGCFYHGHTCQPYRDIPTLSEETLAERYVRTMCRIEQIKRSGYKVTVMWECEFDEAGIVQQKPEFLTHPVVHNTPLTRDALYGGRTEAMCLYYYKARDDETIEYCDMSLYPYICKYGKFPT
jgi:G:T-mismatch repair DNA endonuclease (very short patch repair protein)